MEYVIIFISVIILAKNYWRISPRSQIYFIGFIAIYIILLMGLRYRVGIDTLNYINSYESTPTFDDLRNLNWADNRFEPGYLLLCTLCRSITPNFWLFQIVHSLILCICVFKFIKENTINPYIGIAIYMYLAWLYFNTEILRESLAISFFLLNYRNLKNNRLIKYYIGSLVSISFHYSAIIILFFPLVKFLRFNILYIIACLITLSILPFAEQLSSLINIATITMRVNEQILSAETLNLNWRIAFLIKNLSVPILSIFIYNKLNYKSELMPYILFHILLTIGAVSIPIIFSRFSNYTLPIVIIYVTNLISILICSRKKFTLYSIIIIIFISQIIYYKDMYNAWFPYVSIFSERIIAAREQLWYEHFN